MNLLLFTSAVVLTIIMLVLQIRRAAINIQQRTQSTEAPITSYNRSRQQEMEQRKNNILQYLEKNRRVTSREVENLLDVSNATATRYLQQLSRDKKIKERDQGRATHYIL